MGSKNILFVLPNLGSGGAEINALRLSWPLKNLGYQCTYAILSHKEQFHHDTIDPNSSVINLLEKPASRSTVRMLKGIPSLIRILNERRFDVIMPVLQGPTLAAILAQKASHCRAPIITFIQNANFKKWKESSSISHKGSYVFWSYMYSFCYGAIALTKGVADDFSLATPSLKAQTEIVHNIGIPNSKLEEIDLCGSGMTENIRLQPRIVACGRLVPVKNYPNLLKAIKILSNQFDITLDIIGSGPERDNLKKRCEELQISNRVTFHGFQKSPEHYIARSHIFVLSSDFEGFGNVIVEAMSLGIPVIATDCPYGPREIIDNRINGMLVPVSSPESLAESIQELILNPEFAGELAEAGKRRALDFTADQIGQKFDHALNHIMENDDSVKDRNV